MATSPRRTPTATPRTATCSRDDARDSYVHRDSRLVARGRRRRPGRGRDRRRGAGRAQATARRTSRTWSASSSRRSAPQAQRCTARCYRPWGCYESIDVGDALPGQAHHGQAGRAAVAADASPPRRALDRGARHREVTVRRRGPTAARERVDLHPARRVHRLENPGKDRAGADRGAVRRLPRRGRHRPLRGRFLSPARGVTALN